MSDPVRVAVAANEMEADVICGLLRSEGIRCNHMLADGAAAGISEAGTSGFGVRAILVAADDAERASDLLSEVET